MSVIRPAPLLAVLFIFWHRYFRLLFSPNIRLSTPTVLAAGRHRTHLEASFASWRIGRLNKIAQLPPRKGALRRRLYFRSLNVSFFLSFFLCFIPNFGTIVLACVVQGDHFLNQFFITKSKVVTRETHCLLHRLLCMWKAGLCMRSPSANQSLYVI